jgi:hypothetical protein
MELESITQEESLIKKALIEWTNEISNNYTKRNEIAMDAKIYLSLNKLYLKKKRDTN